MNTFYIVGVDEVGRGPIAGPVSVGVCAVEIKHSKKIFSGIKDSKQLTPSQRNEWYAKLMGMQNSNLIQLTFTSVSSDMVDRVGIVKALKKAVTSGLGKLTIPKEQMKIILDGTLSAPVEYSQKSIIKGDESEPSIAAASIYAKVLRDKKMSQYSKLYPNYSFEKNKGYGTAQHYTAIKKYGLCPLHRKSFLKAILQ